MSKKKCLTRWEKFEEQFELACAELGRTLFFIAAVVMIPMFVGMVTTAVFILKGESQLAAMFGPMVSVLTMFTILCYAGYERKAGMKEEQEKYD